MIASNERTGRVQPIIEIGFYVLLLVGLVFAAVYGVAYFTRQQETSKKVVAKQMKKLVEPAVNELKQMDEETQVSSLPATVAPVAPPTQPVYQPPQYSNPTPVPTMSYQSTPPANTAPRYDGPFVPSSVTGAGSY